MAQAVVSAVKTYQSVKEKINRLGELLHQANKNSFERCKLASEILFDETYIRDRFKGDQGACGDWLQEKYFPDLTGYADVFTIAGIYKTFPNEEVWKDNDYRLAAMKVLWREELKASGEDKQRNKREHPPIKNAVFQQVLAEKDSAEKRLLRVEKDRQDLEELCRKLELENAQLKGRLEELEKYLKRSV